METLTIRTRPSMEVFWACKYELYVDLDKEFLTPYDISIASGVYIRRKPIVL